MLLNVAVLFSSPSHWRTYEAMWTLLFYFLLLITAVITVIEPHAESKMGDDTHNTQAC